jgi:hypothetical protein
MSGRTSIPEQAVRSFSIWKELRSNKKPSTGWYVRTEQMLTQMSTLAVKPILLQTMSFTRKTIVSSSVTKGLVKVTFCTPRLSVFTSLTSAVMLLTSVGPFTPSRWYQRKEELWVSFGLSNEISEGL